MSYPEILRFCFLGFMASSLAVFPQARGLAAPLAPAPSAVDNPLKGLVTRNGPSAHFPHSLEHQYFALREIMAAPDRFTWQPVDRYLDEVASRGNQAVVRVYLEYPRMRSGVPEFLIAAGVKITDWTASKPPSLPMSMQSPNYEDPRLRAAMQQCIAAFGARYDGDPRLGFIEIGFLGAWGEWHLHWRPELFASKQVQAEVLDAFEAAFHKTRILVRNAYGEGDPDRVANAHRPMGYHDDYFGMATIADGQPGHANHFLGRMAKAKATEKWRSQPIGGEICFDVEGCCFDEPGCEPAGQEFARCVELTHASWLVSWNVDKGMFGSRQSEARIRKASQIVRRMGYDFHVAEAEIVTDDKGLQVKLRVRNLGVAPFYYDWPIEIGALDPQGSLAATWRVSWKITGILPGEPDRLWEHAIARPDLPPGQYRFLLRVVNPLPSGKPLRFANATQDADRSGWLTIGSFYWAK